MTLLSRLTAVALLTLTGGCASTVDRPVDATQVQADAPVTILVSIDGFRPDYLHHKRTPHLDTLAKGGVEARMRPSFPSQTFPNHTALATGLYPDHSGIVANSMTDPERPGMPFSHKGPSGLDPFWWKDHDPIWISAEKQGVRTALMFWPGAEVPHGGWQASAWRKFDMNFTEAERVQTVIDWLRAPAATRPRFVTLYLNSVDSIAHRFGPAATETLTAVEQADARIGELLAGLQTLGLAANLIIVSDHGMRDIDPKRATNLNDYLSPDAYHLVIGGAFAMLDPVTGREAEVEAALLKPLPHAQCWRKGELPTRFHYGASIRVSAIVCLAKKGGSIVQGSGWRGGDHGYDPDDPQMQAMFIANGPAIRADARAPRLFDNVDIYPMLARLIGIRPERSDGDPTTLDALVKQP